MKLASSIIILAAANLSSAFSPVLQRRGVFQSKATQGRVLLFSSQWDDEEEDVATDIRASFDEAGQSLKDEEDKDKMDKMGDYDANPAYNSADIDRVREAILARTKDLGIEKSKVTMEAIKEAEARAKEAAANRGGGGQMLDLSQISQTAPRGEEETNVPAMFYEPENEMSDEEMKEADPVGQMSIPEQIMNEFTQATWPTPGAAFKEVFLLIGIVVLTSVLIINWDNLLRDTYTNLGFIPRPEDITSGSENMVLPEGWTNGMSEDDFMNFQDDVATSAGAAVKSAFPDL